jgi:uncharacterized protein YndB with AHSA1/START domain
MMEAKDKIMITVLAKIDAPIQTVWKCWTTPENIVKWNHASDDWHTTHAEVDLREGGKFNSRMEAKDGSFGFDFYGVYEKIVVNQLIECLLGDGRTMRVEFVARDEKTEVIETFEAETMNTIDLQRFGWQAILDNFKKHVEEKSR